MQQHVADLEQRLADATAHNEELKAAYQSSNARCLKLDGEINELLAEVSQVKQLADENLGRALEWQQKYEAGQSTTQLPDMPVLQSPTHPGHLLADLVRQAGTSRRHLAAALGIKPDTLKDLLCGRYNLTLALCGKLEALCWGTAEVWARRQLDYDTHRLALKAATA